MEPAAASKAQLLSVEPVTPETAGLAFELLREFVTSIHMQDEFTATEERYREALFRDVPSIEAVLARYDGEVAGYSHFSVQYDSWAGCDTMRIASIYVRPAFRPKYLAPAIYLYFLSLAKRRGYGAIFGLVSPSNEPLLKLYRNAGASFTDYVRSELKLDQVSDGVLDLGIAQT